MPTVLAASTISVPAGTVTGFPSMVRLISGIGHHTPPHRVGRWRPKAAGGAVFRRMSGTRHYLPDVALVPERVVLIFLAEMTERRVDDPAARITEAAQAAAVLQPVGNALQRVELDLRALVGEDALIGPDRPVLADPAWCAFAARLVRIELEETVRRLDDAMRVVHHDHTAGPGHGSRRGQCLRVGRDVQHRLGQH